MALLTNAGRAIITNRLKGAGTEPNFVAWGTGTTAEAATQTALVTESAEARTTGTSTQQTTTVTNDTYRVVGTITATAARAITESGLFDAVTAGNMFTRAVYSVINLATNDSIQYTWNVQFT
jgi:hypothetical protein